MIIMLLAAYFFPILLIALMHLRVVVFSSFSQYKGFQLRISNFDDDIREPTFMQIRLDSWQNFTTGNIEKPGEKKRRRNIKDGDLKKRGGY